MTTTDAVAVSRSIDGRRSGGTRLHMRLAALAGAVVLGAALAGCGSSNLLGSSDGGVQSATPVAPSLPPAASPPVSQNRVAVAPVMGAPEAVSAQVGSQLGSALERQRVRVAQVSEKPEFTLRGYMVATKERAGTKISYIFDLTDGAGKRVNRIQGEEIGQGGTAADPWSAVSPEIAQRISDKTATSLATALSSLGSGGSTAPVSSPPVGVGAGSTGTPIAAAPVAASSATTGSIARGGAAGAVAAIVPAVSGAPGDGNASLAGAMRNELQQAGIGAAAPGQKAYSVAGKVTLGAVKDGKQPIKIDWRVTDPGGALLATVSQNNEIQAGALDGQWGNIASDAAQGAASRIKQLIEENRAASAGRAGSAQQATSRSPG